LEYQQPEEIFHPRIDDQFSARKECVQL